MIIRDDLFYYGIYDSAIQKRIAFARDEAAAISFLLSIWFGLLLLRTLLRVHEKIVFFRNALSVAEAHVALLLLRQRGPPRA